MSRLEPANDLVLVKDTPREQQIDGITLPDNVHQQEMAFGIVACVGRLVSNATKPQDIVCFGPYAGKTILLEGAEFRLLREGQIEGYIRTDENEKHDKTTNEGVGAD